MVVYHEKTLKLLGLTAQPLQKNLSLEDYDKRNDIGIPASFREWSELDTNGILEKYSNCDLFWLTTLEIVNLNDGNKGLLFSRENQGNFDKIVMLGCRDDPPVLYAWLGKEPWIEFSSTFSDCVYAQVFDWQYMLECDRNGIAVGYYGTLDLKNSYCLAYLKKNFTETVKTQFVVEYEQFEEYRFYRSTKERITVQVAGDNTTSMQITGEYRLVRQLEDELLQQFADALIPPAFNSYGWLATFIGSNIDNKQLVKIAYSCVRRPDSHSLEQLVRCHKAKNLKERFPIGGFPESETAIELGGEQWGVTVSLVKQSPHWWSIGAIAAT